MLLTVIADYGTGDLAFAEVYQHLSRLLPEADITTLSVPPFDTVSAGFCVAQLALNDGPPDRVVYVNVAPRQDTDAPRESNAGEELAAARLDSGVLVVGVASGASLGFLAAEGIALRAVDVPDHGSQFPRPLPGGGGDPRPRRGPPPGGPSHHPAPASAVRRLHRRLRQPQDELARASWSHGKAGPSASGRPEADAVVTDEVFTVPAGEVSFAPGSSGWATTGGGRREFWEVFARGGSAADLFGRPPAGTPVEVEPA